MRVLKFLFSVFLLFVSVVFVYPQRNFASDTTLARKAYDRARSLFDTYNLRNADSIIHYLDVSSSLYGKNSLRSGLLKTLSLEMHVAALLANEKKVMELNSRIESVDKNHNSYKASRDYYLGLFYYTTSKFDTALNFFLNSIEAYKKYQGEKNLGLADSYNMIGNAYREKSEYPKALEYYSKSLELRKELAGSRSILVAKIYNNLGLVYWNISEYDLALEYFNKDLEITKSLGGDNGEDIAASYNNIGNIYWQKAENDQALDYYFKSLEIKIRLLGEKNLDVAKSYANVGNVYSDMLENDKALEYYQKSLGIYLELTGEKNRDVALTLNNIGTIYEGKSDYELALNYYLKSLKIRKDLLGENNLDVAQSYNNIGIIYEDKHEYEPALQYFFKDFEISKNLLGLKSIEIAQSYANIGRVYSEKMNYGFAIDYYTRSLKIFKELLGEKHSSIANVCNRIGTAYKANSDYSKAIKYFQFALYSNVLNFNDTTDLTSNPPIDHYMDFPQLLVSLENKAQIFEKLGDDKTNRIACVPPLKLTSLEYYRHSLHVYETCDSLISMARKKISKTSDKLTLGANASEIYQDAMNVCLKLASSENSEKESYFEKAFYFSEQDKNIVLLEAIASAEGMKFSGIPDSLLSKEHQLKTSINTIEKRVAEESDSASMAILRNQLFIANRQYEKLIEDFEKRYPKYYNLKYRDIYPAVNDIKAILDDSTALRGYLVGDSNIYIYTLTNKSLEFRKVRKMSMLDDTVEILRSSLTNLGEASKDAYLKAGYSLYKQLFPELSFINETGNSVHPIKNITHLVIVPDGSLGVIPFEALLYDTTGLKQLPFQVYPYLIRRYNISYSYSASLFYYTALRSSKDSVKFTNLNDWLAMAPVFDDETGNQNLMATRELKDKLDKLKLNPSQKRGVMLNGDYISSLPGTENEVTEIFNVYKGQHLNAEVLLHKDANEQFIKSGGLENFKVLHFASHGFVNSEIPELSGILLSQDTAGGQDGILYSGEIYSLNLNANLVVLSACETGLGKFLRGEGIIGLTRALLYAGTKNIIVSLWQVNDQSTSDLMVDFYKNLLKSKKDVPFSEFLRSAKLNMIREGKYSHPFYWSPFIIIGR